MKYLKRLAARNAFQRLLESKNKYIVTRKMILESEDGDTELEVGDEIEMGATPDGDLGVNTGSAAVVVISDPEIAKRVSDVVASADELADVNFVQKPALDSVLDSGNIEDTIEDLSSNEEGNDDVEVAEVEPAEESVDSKLGKIAENRINPAKTVACESVLIADEAEPLTMSRIKCQKVVMESFEDYKSFCEAVSARKGSLQPGETELALNESAKFIGKFDKAANRGTLFVENEFEDAESMDEFSTEAEPVMTDMEFDDMDDVVEACLGKYEESKKTGADYLEMTKTLEEAGLAEDKIRMIVESFKMPSVRECVRPFDSKYGVYCACMKESVDADNFIAETKEEKRFSKRFFN